VDRDGSLKAEFSSVSPGRYLAVELSPTALARDSPAVRWTSFEAWARRFDWSAFLAG
jgi:hypothetical protein